MILQRFVHFTAKAL